MVSKDNHVFIVFFVVLAVERDAAISQTAGDMGVIRFFVLQHEITLWIAVGQLKGKAQLVYQVLLKGILGQADDTVVEKYRTAAPLRHARHPVLQHGDITRLVSRRIALAKLRDNTGG